MRKITTLFLLLVFFGLAVRPHLVSAADFILIRNAANATGRLGKSDVKDIFTGKRKSWDSGTPIQLVLSGEDAAEMGWLAATFFGTNARALLNKIKQEVFKGEVMKPAFVGSEEEAVQKVKSTPGAVAVVTAGASLPAGVAAISVGQ